VLPKLAKDCVSSRTSEHTHTNTHALQWNHYGMQYRKFSEKISDLSPGDLAHLRQYCTQSNAHTNRNTKFLYLKSTLHLIYVIWFTWRVNTKLLPIMHCWFEQCWHFGQRTNYGPSFNLSNHNPQFLILLPWCSVENNKCLKSIALSNKLKALALSEIDFKLLLNYSLFFFY